MNGVSWIALDADPDDDRTLEVAWDKDQRTAVVTVRMDGDARAVAVTLSDLLTILAQLWRVVKKSGVEPGTLVVAEPNTDGSGRGPWMVVQ